MPTRRRPFAAALILLLLAAAACSRFLPTRIGEIAKDPRRYDGKVVTVTGEVTESVNVLVMRYYVVSDGTGEITVITDGAVPQRGAEVRVTGRVSQAFSLGDKNLTVLKESPR